MAGGWDIIVRTFFSDGGLSAGLAKANAALQNVSKSGPGARAGLKAVEIGARQLAFEAAGLQGGIGQLARGLLQFGGGSALMLGAVAGIGAVAFAYRAMTKDSREAAEQQKKLREELHRVAEAARESRLAGTVRIAGQQGQRQDIFADLNARIAAQMAVLRSQVGAQRFEHETDEQTLQRLIASDAELNKLYRERRALGQDIRTERESSADASEKEADALKRAADDARRLKLEAIQFLQAQIQLEKGGVFRALPISFRAPGFGAGGLAPGPSTTTFANIRSNVPRFVAPDIMPTKEPFPTAAVAAAAIAALGAMKAGGTGGAISGLGGLATALSGAKGLSLLSPIGLGLTALGGVFSLFDNSEERRHKEQMRELKKISERPLLEPRAVTVNLIDASTGRRVAQTQYEIGRREDRDASDRDGRAA